MPGPCISSFGRWRDLHDYFRLDVEDEEEFFFTVSKWESRDDIVELFHEAVYWWAEGAREYVSPQPVDL